MLTYMVVNDKDYNVRIAVVNALGSLGPAAKKAVPHLKQIMSLQPVANHNASKEEMDQEMRLGDLKRAVRDALVKIGE